MFKNILDWLLHTWKIKHTKRGALYILGFWNAFIFAIVGFSVGVLKLFESKITSEIVITIFIVVILLLVLGNAILFGIWNYFTSIPNYLNSDIGVIFGPHYDEACNEIILKLFEALKEKLSSKSFPSGIKTRLLPDNFKINGPEDAHKIIVQSNAFLVIHGNVESGKIKSEYYEGFKSVSFTFKNKPNIDLSNHPILKDVTHALAFRKYFVNENNSLIELDVFKNSMSECALFFLGLSMILEGKHLEVKPIIENLYNDVSTQTNSNPHFLKFKNLVHELYCVCLESLFKYKYYNSLVYEITNPEFHSTAIECQGYLDKLIHLNKRSDEFLLSHAIISFHFQDLKKSMNYVNQAKLYSNKMDPGPNFSAGFLYLWAGEYKKSIKEYQLAFLKGDFNVENYSGILNFLEGLREKFPERIELQFALALFLENYCDKEIAKSEYIDFLKNAKEGQEMVIIFDYAKKRLSKL